MARTDPRFAMYNSFMGATQHVIQETAPETLPLDLAPLFEEVVALHADVVLPRITQSQILPLSPDQARSGTLIVPILPEEECVVARPSLMTPTPARLALMSEIMELPKAEVEEICRDGMTQFEVLHPEGLAVYPRDTIISSLQTSWKIQAEGRPTVDYIGRPLITFGADYAGKGNLLAIEERGALGLYALASAVVTQQNRIPMGAGPEAVGAAQAAITNALDLTYAVIEANNMPADHFITKWLQPYPGAESS